MRSHPTRIRHDPVMIMAAKRGFGQIQRLRPSATGPGTSARTVRCAPRRHVRRRLDAEAWLTDERRLIAAGTWLRRRTAAKPQPVQAARSARYAENWSPPGALKPRTREHYRRLLDRQILPASATARPRSPRTSCGPGGPSSATGTPTLRAHAYSLLRSILHDAVADGLITANPCHIRGAGNAKRVHRIKPATLAELEVLVGAMPKRYRLMVLLAAWCGLRFGELTELRRSDIDVDQRRHPRSAWRGARQRRGHRRSPKTDAGSGT